MKKIISLLFVIGMMMTTGRAQTLFMSRDIKTAFDNETRSPDGKPGKNYWQNHGHYTIDMTVMPPNRNVQGKESIVYFNNSPDTLQGLNFKLFLNIHKPGAPRDGGALDDYLTSGIHIDKFLINGEEQDVNNRRFTFTNLGVRLPQALVPKDSVQISVEWHYEISLQSGREGMIDSTTYFLAYFYPRVAVYDDYNGWDRMEFVESHEFYSDFNNYDVRIHVPKNFIVWGTGTLQNPETVLQPDFLKKYNASFISDDIVHVVTAKDLAAKNITTQNEMNTWHFTSSDIPDVAFGISDHFCWDATSTIVDDKTKRRASAQAAYNDTASDYHYVAGYAQHSLNWLSHNWPGVPYPYEKSTVFQGYAGMEYPMMANDESYADTNFSRFVAEHEIAHTYMPFYMGINETRYGFMDEGWATTFEYLIGTADMGAKRADRFYKQFRVQGWTYANSSLAQIPIITPGDAISGMGLGANEYGKASLGYLAVKDLLGDALFKRCLHAYMDRWHGKHPTPWDFFNTFNDVSGQNLNWFWNNWFFSTHYNDLQIFYVQGAGGEYSIMVKNIGGFCSPFDLITTYDDGTTSTKHITPAYWENDQRIMTVKMTSQKKIRSFKIDGGIFMDANPADNMKTFDNKD